MRDEERERIVKMHYKCATLDQYEEWRKAARLSPPAFPAWFCADCTPQYQLEMKKKGWCVRLEVKFKRTASDGIEGYLPSKHTRTGELF